MKLNVPERTIELLDAQKINKYTDANITDILFENQEIIEKIVDAIDAASEEGKYFCIIESSVYKDVCDSEAIILFLKDFGYVVTDSPKYGYDYDYSCSSATGTTGWVVASVPGFSGIKISWAYPAESFEGR